MSRSAIELTRFTATAPHAYSKTSALRNVFLPSKQSNRQPPLHALPAHRSPQPNASSSIPSPPPPPSETAAQKVARLRAARFKARMAQIPLWDRVVVEGRIWADRIHRITTSLILIASIIAFGVAVVSLSDMIIFNRRKRRAYIKEQNIIYQDRVDAAIKAERSGQELSEEQELILGRERVRLEEEDAAERRKTERWWITKWLLDGLKMGEGNEAEVVVKARMGSGDAGGSSGEIRDQQTTGLNAAIPEKQQQQIASSPILRAVQEQQPQSQSQSQSQS